MDSGSPDQFSRVTEEATNRGLLIHDVPVKARLFQFMETLKMIAGALFWLAGLLASLIAISSIGALIAGIIALVCWLIP